MHPDIRPGSSRIPLLTLAALTGASEWKLLLVLDPALAFRSRVRRTTAVRNFAAGMLRVYPSLPGYWTVAAALACEPQRLQEAVDALFAAGYPVTRPPISPDDIAWLRSGRN